MPSHGEITPAFARLGSEGVDLLRASAAALPAHERKPRAPRPGRCARVWSALPFDDLPAPKRPRSISLWNLPSSATSRKAHVKKAVRFCATLPSLPPLPIAADAAHCFELDRPAYYHLAACGTRRARRASPTRPSSRPGRSAQRGAFLSLPLPSFLTAVTSTASSPFESTPPSRSAPSQLGSNMGQRRVASPPSPRHRTQAEVDAAICRLMLPILPYMGPGTSTLEDATEASDTALADALPAERAVVEPAPTSSSSTRRRLAEPSAASWTLTSSALDTPTDPPPAYDDLYGRPAPAPRRRSLSFFPSSHPSTSPATTPSSSTSTSPTDSEFSWTRRPSAQLERLDSGYGSLASTRSRESRGSCASVREGELEQGGAAAERKKAGVLKKVGRALGRERASSSSFSSARCARFLC